MINAESDSNTYWLRLAHYVCDSDSLHVLCADTSQNYSCLIPIYIGTPLQRTDTFTSNNNKEAKF
jgi:hypothetical protein